MCFHDPCIPLIILGIADNKRGKLLVENLPLLIVACRSRVSDAVERAQKRVGMMSAAACWQCKQCILSKLF